MPYTIVRSIQIKSSDECHIQVILSIGICTECKTTWIDHVLCNEKVYFQIKFSEFCKLKGEIVSELFKIKNSEAARINSVPPQLTNQTQQSLRLS